MFRFKDLTLSLDTNAYTVGDVLAATQALSNAFLDIGAGAILRSLILIDKDDQKAALDILFLDADVSVGAENGAPDITDANAASLLTKIAVAAADYYDLGGVSVVEYHGLDRVLQPVSGGKSLFVAVVNGAGTPTYSAAGLVLRLGLELQR